MTRIGRWYNNLAFRRKVFLSHLTVSLFPVVILGMFCYFQTRHLLVQREREVVAETLSQSAGNLNAALDLYRHVLENITWDVKLKEALSTQYQDNLEMYLAYRDIIDPSVTQMKSLYPNIRQITIYSSNDTLYPHGDILKKSDEAGRFQEPLMDYNVHWQADGEVLALYSRIYQDGYPYQNVVYLAMDYTSMFRFLSGLFGDHYGILVADGEETVYSYDCLGQKEGCAPLTLENITAGDSCLEYYVLEQRQIPANGWTMYLYRPIRVVSSSAMSITVLILGAVVVCLAIILLLSISLSRRVVQPLSKLARNIEEIEAGNLTVMVREDSGDEIGQLIGSFSRMVERLNYLVNEVYKSKIAQQQYELKALQAQINPHFLYNSLSLINWKAIMADQAEISEMAQLLSTFYRTTLNKGKSVTTVRSEWENTCSYVRIQSIMHSGRFDAELSVEDSMLDCPVLNLILQPLVENAISHGLDHKEGTDRKKLWVLGRERDGLLEFEVRDNGCGIPEDKVEQVLSTKSSGYGLQNVHHRIRLYYGEKYGLKIASRVGEGTCVLVRIPRDHAEKQ